MAIRLSENFRALFYAPFYAAHAIGAYQAEGVEVELMSSPDPARTAAALRNGEIDAMWGGPLRVMLTHASDPAADSVCFCDVIARDPFFIVGREPRRIGGDLEQDAARLAKVDRMEVHAIDDRRDVADARRELGAPLLLLVVGQRPECDVMDHPGAEIARRGLWLQDEIDD